LFCDCAAPGGGSIFIDVVSTGGATGSEITFITIASIAASVAASVESLILNTGTTALGPETEVSGPATVILMASIPTALLGADDGGLTRCLFGSDWAKVCIKKAGSLE
jgi:hypothetical protein